MGTKYRITKHYTSLADPKKFSLKIQYKSGRFWRDYRTHGMIKLFDNKYHAENYLSLLLHPGRVTHNDLTLFD